MKLSELKGTRTLDVIADLIAPITNIAMDQQNLQLFKAEKLDGETDQDMVLREFKSKVPRLLKTHKQDVLDIICALNDKKPEEMNIVEIIHDAMDIVKDREFLNLFLSAVKSGETPQPIESSANAELSEPES